jgi:hypothetical protein
MSLCAHCLVKYLSWETACKNHKGKKYNVNLLKTGFCSEMFSSKPYKSLSQCIPMPFTQLWCKTKGNDLVNKYT